MQKEKKQEGPARAPVCEDANFLVKYSMQNLWISP